jgi:hypothetical protein
LTDVPDDTDGYIAEVQYSDDLSFSIAAVQIQSEYGLNSNYGSRSGRSVVVLALNRKPRVNPILFAHGIITHFCVSQRRQFTGGVL